MRSVYGKLILTGNHRLQRTLSQRAMADFPTARRTERPASPTLKGGKVVMEHKGPGVLALQSVDPLLVIRRTQSHDGQALRFSPGKQRGAMSAWQHADLAGDRPNIRRPTPVGT